MLAQLVLPVSWLCHNYELPVGTQVCPELSSYTNDSAGISHDSKDHGSGTPENQASGCSLAGTHLLVHHLPGLTWWRLGMPFQRLAPLHQRVVQKSL